MYKSVWEIIVGRLGCYTPKLEIFLILPYRYIQIDLTESKHNPGKEKFKYFQQDDLLYFKYDINVPYEMCFII